MRIYNTLTRQKEEFVPIEEGKVGIYACGPTVYDYIHVGNARAVVVFDTLRRFFEYDGYDVKFVVNFTDIDDKVINKALAEGVGYRDISDRYIKAYMEDSISLNVKEETTFHPKATDHIEDIIEFIEGLINKGAAYNVDGNVYFRVSQAEDYGKLSNKNVEDLKAGARIEVTEDKESPVDFALWKKAKAGEPAWESPWGPGRPGWHIECSVMSKEHLGETIDIHGGGEDLQFPHHENEIAQSETLSDQSFARYWMHNGMITVDNKKMSKSEGNFFTIRDIKKDFHPEVIRFFLLSSHYRTPLNFSREIMEQMEHALDRLYIGRKNLEYLRDKTQSAKEDPKDLKALAEIEEKFVLGMRDDLNTAEGVTALFDLVKYANQNFTVASSRETVESFLEKLIELANVLGLLYREEEILDEDIEALIEERQEARKNKDFALADKIRDDLIDRGIILEDTKDGVKWRRS